MPYYSRKDGGEATASGYYDDLMPPTTSSEGVPLGALLRVWLLLSLQSFGGGAATLTLIRREVVERRGWLTDAEFVRDWALCQVAPGINLLALTILIGRRLAGVPGICLALVGLLLPSVAITVALTASYAHFRNTPAVQASLRGVIPATVGLGLLTAYQMARALLTAARREGKTSLLWSLAVLMGSGLVMALWQPPVVLVLCAAGAAGALLHWGHDVRRRRRQP